MFFVSLCVTHGAIAVYLTYRILSRDGLPLARQSRFQPISSRASAGIANLAARRRRPTNGRSATGGMPRRR